MLALKIAQSIALVAAAILTITANLVASSPQSSSACQGGSCPLSLFPTCHAQADLCTSGDWFEHCGPGRSFVTTEKWKFCHWSWWRNVLADSKHCGQCRTACPDDLPHCVSGVCRSTPGVIANIRIEAAEGTLFEGQVATTAHNLSAPETDVHECRGPTPPSYASIMTLMDDATRLNGINWTGTWYYGVEDWEIYSIGNSTHGYDSNGVWRTWVVWENFVPGNGSGWPCRNPVTADPSFRWLWGFHEGPEWIERTLELTGPSSARIGEPVTYTVTGRDELSREWKAAGAKVRDQYTNDTGQVTFTFDKPCIYHLKASKVGHIRSNSIWTTVW